MSETSGEEISECIKKSLVEEFRDSKFDRVQLLLGRDGKPRPNRHREYAYNGLISCGDCGGYVSATCEEKIIKKTGKLKAYYLYYCTCARRRERLCPHRRYTNVDRMEEQIEQELMSLTILSEFKNWALQIIAEKHDEEVVDRTTIYESQQKVLNDTQKQLDNLTQLRLRELIEDEENTSRSARASRTKL